MSLQWWEVWGSYASALVAAETEERAVELASGAVDRGWWGAHPADKPVPPAPAPVEGVYAWWAE